MLKKKAGVLLASVLFIVGTPVSAEWDEKKMAEKIDKLVSKMTLEEKASMTSGRDAWSTQPIALRYSVYLDGRWSAWPTKSARNAFVGLW